MRHPTTSFLVFKNLLPLGKDPANLARLSHTDVKPLIGEDPYSKLEEQLIAEYTSAVTIPQMVFLGIDERNEDGLQWKIYRGAPYFALDVTPRGTVEEQAHSLISELEGRGLKFIEGRVQMSLPAPEGYRLHLYDRFLEPAA